MFKKNLFPCSVLICSLALQAVALVAEITFEQRIHQANVIFVGSMKTIESVQVDKIEWNKISFEISDLIKNTSSDIPANATQFSVLISPNNALSSNVVGEKALEIMNVRAWPKYPGMLLGSGMSLSIDESEANNEVLTSSLDNQTLFIADIKDGQLQMSTLKSEAIRLSAFIEQIKTIILTK